MNNDFFNAKSLKEFFETNMGFVESFFEGNSVDDNFIENVKNKISTNASNSQDKSGGRDISVDIIKKNNEILCIFEIPGLSSKDDVNINFLGSTLIVEGEIIRNYESASNDVSNFQRNIGHFSKKVNLPYVVDMNRINAKYKSGLLEVRLPIIKPKNSENIDIDYFYD